MKQWHIFDKVYRSWLVIFIGSMDDFKHEMKLIGYKKIEELDVPCTGMLIDMQPEDNDMGNNCYVMYLDSFKMATLIHEISHLVMAVFTDHGVPISQDNTEGFAFYSEFWYQSITRIKRKYPNGNKPKDARH